MQYTRFERARIIGARALQIAMGAPILIPADNLFSPVRVAVAEYDAGVIPITVHRQAKAKEAAA